MFFKKIPAKHPNGRSGHVHKAKDGVCQNGHATVCTSSDCEGWDCHRPCPPSYAFTADIYKKQISEQGAQRS